MDQVSVCFLQLIAALRSYQARSSLVCAPEARGLKTFHFPNLNLKKKSDIIVEVGVHPKRHHIK